MGDRRTSDPTSADVLWGAQTESARRMFANITSETLPCSTWRLTASYAAVTSSIFAFATSLMAARFWLELWSWNERRKGRLSLS